MIDPLISLLITGFLVAVGLLLFWPDRGLLARRRQMRRVTERVLREDALKHIHDGEMAGRPATMASIAGVLQRTVDKTAQLVTDMETHGLLTVAADEFKLTPRGRDYALQIIRAHRLWERFLADTTGYAEAEWHGQAERFEHDLSPAEADALAARLGNPTHDPHGDPIPSASGDLVSHGGRPLTTLGLDRPGRIVHLEDEPEAIYAQLVAEGLHPGLEVRLTEISRHRVRFWADGDEHVLAPLLASNVSVVALAQEDAVEVEPCQRLSSLRPGERGTVISISPACRGLERRRLMDLGLLPGTQVAAELKSPSGDPTAYRIRGAVIALRREQADLINITRQKGTP
jgi:DtxR family transcriptional regulator, Mn-dependent transcriptional regulator